MEGLPAHLEALSLQQDRGAAPATATVSTQTGQETVEHDGIEYINGKHPIRRGKPACPYYGKKGGRCSFGRKCRYDHSQATQADQPAEVNAVPPPAPVNEGPAHERAVAAVPPMDGVLAQAALRAWPWRAGRRSFLKGVLAAHIIETAYAAAADSVATVEYKLNTAQAGPVLQEAWRHQQGRAVDTHQKPYSTLGKLLDGDPYLSIQEDPLKPGCNWVVLNVALLEADFGCSSSIANSAAPPVAGAALGGAGGLTGAWGNGKRAGGKGSAQQLPAAVGAGSSMAYAAGAADGSARGAAAGAAGAGSSSSSNSSAGLFAAAPGPFAAGAAGAAVGGMHAGYASRLYPVGYGVTYGSGGGYGPMAYSPQGGTAGGLLYGGQGRLPSNGLGAMRPPMHR